jgi:hypothetical protein
MTLTKTAALRQACKLIKLQRFNDHQWILVHPWRMADPDGPWTTGQPRDWARARRYLTEARAEYALALMGHEFPCVYDYDGDLVGIVTRYHSYKWQGF